MKRVWNINQRKTECPGCENSNRFLPLFEVFTGMSVDDFTNAEQVWKSWLFYSASDITPVERRIYRLVTKWTVTQYIIQLESGQNAEMDIPSEDMQMEISTGRSVWYHKLLVK